MAQQTVNVGTSASDGTGDDLRVAFTKINENFTELYSGNVNVVAANVLVHSVAGRTGNVVLTVSDITGGVSKAYVDASISANIAGVTGAIFNELNANVAAANIIIADNSGRITVLEANSATQATQIINLSSVKADISYVDTSIDLALSNSAIAIDIDGINANVAAANLIIANLQSNAATQDTTLNNLISNAAAQAVSINSLLSNAGSQATSLNNLLANAASQQNAITALQGNTGVLAFAVDTLTANAASQSLQFDSVTSNFTAVNVAISNLVSNSVSQALEINNLYGNAGAQATILNTLISNASTQATSIDTLNNNYSILVSNAASQTVSINNLTANVNSLTGNAASQGASLNSLLANSSVQAQQIDVLNANVAAANLVVLTNTNKVNAANLAIMATNANVSAANAAIILINANVTAANANISTIYDLISLGNASLIDLYSNISTINTILDLGNAALSSQANAISTKANINNPIFVGNVQAEYIISNANIISTGIFESVQAENTINFPNLGSRFISNIPSYYQLVLQNLSSDSNASGEVVITADTGNDENNYMTIGINSSTFNNQWHDTIFTENPLDGFVECIGGNIALRTLSNVFIAAANSLVVLTPDGDLSLVNMNLRFSDGSTQSSAWTTGLHANLGTATTNITTLFGNIASLQLDQPYTMANYQNWNGNVSTVGSALDQLAQRLKDAGF